MPRRRRRKATIRRQPNATITPGGLTDNSGFRDTLTAAPGSPAPTSTRPAMPAPTYDSQYTSEMADTTAAYTTALAELGIHRGRIAFDTGFGANGEVDLSNPYSQAMMLQRSWEQGGRGIQNSMASRGQLYSGARRNAHDESNFQYERNRSTLQTGTARAYEDLTLEERRLQDAKTASENAARSGQAQRWSDQERDWYEQYA